jgi:branched-chain amino acid transport system permease protein
VALDQFLQYVFSGITNGSIYALTALGFTLIYNATDIINFAQGEFVMLGGLTAISLYEWGVPLPIACLGAVAIVALIGVIFELLAIRPLLSAGIMTQIIVTVGASLALRTAAMIIWGREALPLPPLTGDTPINVLGATILPQTLWVLGATLAIVVALQLFYKRTLTGKAVRACSVNPTAARLMGVSYSRVVLLSFGLSAAIAATGGVLIGLKGFAACILGGLGNPAGAVAGGLILGVLESLTVGFLPIQGSSGYKDAVAFLILLLVLFVKPQGLFGQRTMDKV